MNNQIQINQLLMEREDRLVDVFELERQMNHILGEPYPLEAPDALPSRQKRKKPARKPAPKKAPVIRLRPLNPDAETAYRIHYREHGEEKIETHLDPKPLALLVNTPLPHIEVLRIETVHTLDEKECLAVETLFNA